MGLNAGEGAVPNNPARHRATFRRKRRHLRLVPLSTIALFIRDLQRNLIGQPEATIVMLHEVTGFFAQRTLGVSHVSGAHTLLVL